MIQLNIKKLYEDAIIPSSKNTSDAGLDFYAYKEDDVLPGSTTVVSTGIAVEMNIVPSFEFLRATFGPHLNFDNDIYKIMRTFFLANFKTKMQIESRSGLASKGIHVEGGVIDQDYRGEIKIVLCNTSKYIYRINKGDRIAQGVCEMIPEVRSVEVESFNQEETERGENGFGSSGE